MGKFKNLEQTILTLAQNAVANGALKEHDVKHSIKTVCGDVSALDGGLAMEQMPHVQEKQTVTGSLEGLHMGAECAMNHTFKKGLIGTNAAAGRSRYW